ncbi:copper resistance protein B [Methylobacter psychrophilus]|uniref:copper resistance protein B n=1 Tax=Methylobacter psychrophilus TaxID=96941 RepID=UPI0021D4C0ED|nr:copper resistance protein B [Methylobacter psychrophilus]
MSYRINLIVSLMVLNVSSCWAQENPVIVDHSHHSVVTNSEKSNKKSMTAPVVKAGGMENMPGMDHSKMDHSKMDHGSMPGMDQNDPANTGHDMNHGATSSVQAVDMSSMNHGDAKSLSMQGGFAPSDARDPHVYSEGYDFGSMSHPQMGDEDMLASLLVDRLESVTTQGSTSMTYDWQAWFGQTYNRALIRAEGDIEAGTFKDSRNELLWAHAVTAYWDTQLGVRYDSGKGTDRGWLAFGVQGLAPYWLYVEATGYVNERGRVAFRLETEYDLLLTQKLIMQPRMEMNFYSQRDYTRAVSSGLSDFNGGVRLRYEIRREIAPYIGVEWAGKFGSAADYMRTTGDVPQGTRFVAGARFWF